MITSHIKAGMQLVIYTIIAVDICYKKMLHKKHLVLNLSDVASFVWMWICCSSFLIMTYPMINKINTVANWIIFAACIQLHIQNRRSGLLANTYDEGIAKCHALTVWSICLNVWCEICWTHYDYFGKQIPCIRWSRFLTNRKWLVAQRWLIWRDTK